MDKSPSSAADVFAEAVELPPGGARDQLLAERCGEDAALRREVASLLHAHENAGGFLKPPPLQPDDQPGSSTSHSTDVSNPAVQADAFLRGFSRPDSTQVEHFVAQLPKAVRPEARDRIQAGLHVRQLRGQVLRPASEHAEELPRLLGFRIETKLGQGGLGVVYAAHDEKLNRRVVIKVLRRHADEQVRRRVLEEARHTAALSDPAVVTVFSVLDDADPPAIVMEFVEGYPLDRFAAQLNFEQKARLLREVARGLSVAVADARGRAGGLRAGELPAGGPGPRGPQTVHHRAGSSGLDRGVGRVPVRKIRNPRGRAIWQITRTKQNGKPAGSSSQSNSDCGI